MLHAAISHPAKDSLISPWIELLDRVQARQARVGVIGLGYVGLPLAVAFAHRGFPVTGYDLDERKIGDLQAGRSYILDVPDTALSVVVANERLRATTDIGALAAADILVICVPTPCRRNREPDLRYIEQAAQSIAGILRPGQLVILESTTYPGTTEELLAPILESSGRRLFDDFLVAFSPERIDPGNPTFHVENTPKVVGGLGRAAGDIAEALYGAIVARVVRVGSPREAEMAKLIENTFRHVNIALANELGLVAKRMGIDIWQAIEAASFKPFGFMPFFPGPGVGGHCIPVDPHYLSWKARELGCETHFIDLASRINHGMPAHVVHLVVDAVNGRGKSIRDAGVLLLGLAYKQDIDDVRESPALEILDLLLERGARVQYHDPFVPAFHDDRHDLQSLPLTPKALAGADCVVLVTDHSSYNKAQIVAHAPVIVDTRNSLRAFAGEHIVRL